MVFSLDLRLWRTISKEMFANHGVEFRKEMMDKSGGFWECCSRKHVETRSLCWDIE